jgi:uncharacterized protein (DUF1015 family)
VVGLVPTSAAQSGHIKVHESTLSHRESLFARYLSEVGLNAEPTLLAHEDSSALNAVLAEVKAGRPDLDFTTADGVRHTLWRSTVEQRKLLEDVYGGLDAAYIADGHHRVASSMRLAEEQPERSDAHAFMALLVPENELIFRGYHRMVSIGGNATAIALESLKEMAGVSWKEEGNALHPEADEIVLRGRFDGVLSIGPALQENGLTAPEWLQEKVLAPLFGIDDPRADARLSYLPGDASESELQGMANDVASLTFVMPALDFSGLKAVADAGRFMPPKSTWIAPKLRSGLTLFDFGPAP